MFEFLYNFDDVPKSFYQTVYFFLPLKRFVVHLVDRREIFYQVLTKLIQLVYSYHRSVGLVISYFLLVNSRIQIYLELFIFYPLKVVLVRIVYLWGLL